LAERHFADHFNLRPGDQIEVFIAGEWQPVTVSGIAISAEYLWPARSRQDILTPPDDFGVIFVAESLGSRLDLAPQALVRLDSGGSSQDLEHLRDLATDAGATDVYGRAQQPSNAALQEDVSGFGELAWMFPALFLTAAGLTTYILLSRLVQSQRANIGMFLANGMPARTVLVHYLGYGLVPAFVAGMAGAVGGTLLGGALTHLYTDALSIPLTVTHINPLASSVGVGVAILAGTAATILPAWSAARVEPAIAMRGESRPARGRPAWAERLIPAARRLPLQARLVLRNIGRRGCAR